MKKNRLFALLLCICLVASLPVFATEPAVMAMAGGWNETVWVKIPGISDADITAVSYAGTVTGSLTGQDFEYLVRDTEDGVRIDIPGLPAGNYNVTVSTKNGDVVCENVTVDAQDRSGFAHFGDTEGVGAYDNEGKLKENAIVLYVTDENKDTVTVTSKDGTTVSGIGNILNSAGKERSNGKTGGGGIANTNQDILSKLAADGTPLVVRILGRVTLPFGLTAYNSVDYGGSKGDNGAMARMQSGKHITIEGIGTGATIDGWGLHFICGGGDYARGWGRSFEVRNLTFVNVPEDCVGMEGDQKDTILEAPVERCWVHNCAFYAPKIANPAESDKDGGDGACDFKRGQYFTNSYCYYEGYHKTNLVGAGDENLQFHITYHHNYWKNCESRGPLARQANIHMYNNIFEGQRSYCMSLRANTYIFSEYNLFLDSKNVTDGKNGGVCKSYNNWFTSSSGTTYSDLKVVSDKSATVSSNNRYANFDTNASLSYIPEGDYILQQSIEDMKAAVIAQSGPQAKSPVSPEDVNTSIIPAASYPTAAVVLDYSQNLNKTYVTANSGTFDNIVFHVTKTAADSVTVGGSSGFNIVFYVGTEVNISMTGISGSASAVLCSAAGESLLEGSGVVCVPAGYYFIRSNTYDAGSGKYKEAKISMLTIQAVDPNAAENPIPTPPPVGGDPDVGGGDDTEPGGDVTIPAGSYIHNFTDNGKESSFFTITGNLSTSKGSVSFDGNTLTQCLKMESSTEIRFGAPEDGKLILIFGGSTNAAGKTVKIDGTKYTVGTDNTLSVDVTAGWHTITKGDSINLFYMAYSSTSTPPEHVHEYTVEVTKAATCTEAGEAIYTCTCGDSYTKATPVTAHSYETEVKQPTCTEGGGVVHQCAACGKSYTDAQTAPTGHNYGEETMAPTCTQDGYTVYTCEACGDSYQETTAVATGHRYETTDTAEATVYTCSVCGHSYQNEKTPCAHDFGAWINVKEPTKEAGGLQQRTCTLCGEQETQEIPQIGHLRAYHGWIWAAVGACGVVGIAVIFVLKKRKIA